MMRYALDEPCVVVPARVAFLLARKLPLADFRSAAYGIDPELYAVLQAWHGVALTYEAQATRGPREISGRSLANRAEVVSSCEQEPFLLGTSQVADLAKTTERAIRLAATQGRLEGAKDEAGAWRFRRADVAEWLTSRRRCA